ncbi:hypothetical protein D3C73_1203600 [compost metagenome]
MDGAHTAAEILGHIRRLVQGQRHDGISDLRPDIVQIIVDRIRQDDGKTEIPDEQLDQHRHVAMIFNEGRDKELRRLELDRPNDGENDSQHETDDPGENEDHHRGLESLQDEFEILTLQDLTKVELVTHQS